MSSDIGFLFNTQKQKYKDLDSLLPDYLFESSSMNIFIDTEYLFTNFFIEAFKELAVNVVEEKLTYEVASEVINFIGHYRNYFAKHGIATRFFLMHGFTDEIMKDLDYPDYLKRKISKQVHPSLMKFIDFVINKRVSPVVKQIPEVYLLNATGVDKTMYPFILNQKVRNSADKGMFENKKRKNFFITTDKRFIQYLYLFNNTTIFNGRSVVNISNPFDHITKKYKKINPISPYAIVPYLALAGNDGIPPLLPIFESKPRKVIGLFENFEISVDDYNNVSKITDRVIESKLSSVEEMMSVPISIELNNRFSAFDIIDKVNNRLQSNDALSVVDCLDREEPDIRLLHEMNDEYFDSEIDITMLV